MNETSIGSIPGAESALSPRGALAVVVSTISTTSSTCTALCCDGGVPPLSSSSAAAAPESFNFSWRVAWSKTGVRSFRDGKSVLNPCMIPASAKCCRKQQQKKNSAAKYKGIDDCVILKVGREFFLLDGFLAIDFDTVSSSKSGAVVWYQKAACF